MLYAKLQIDHSADCAIAQLVNQIYQTLSKNEYALVVFIHLPKTFDTVNDLVLLGQLHLFCIIMHACVNIYLSSLLLYSEVDRSCNIS